MKIEFSETGTNLYLPDINTVPAGYYISFRNSGNTRTIVNSPKDIGGELRPEWIELSSNI